MKRTHLLSEQTSAVEAYATSSATVDEFVMSSLHVLLEQGKLSGVEGA